MRRTPIFVAALFSCGIARAVAADPTATPVPTAPAPVAQTVQAEGVTASVEVQQYADGDVLNPITFRITISNRNPPSEPSIKIDKIALQLQEPLDSFWKESSPDYAEDIINSTVASGKVLIRTRSLPGLAPTWSTYWQRILGNPRMLTFWPGRYSGQVTVHCRELSENGAHFEVSAPISATFTAPLGAIIAGSLVGSFLCIGFRFFWRRSRISPIPSLLPELKDSAHFVAASAFTGIILCLVLYRTKGFELPFTITVNDFFGGILVGMAAYKSMDILYEKFFGSETKPKSETTKLEATGLETSDVVGSHKEQPSCGESKIK